MKLKENLMLTDWFPPHVKPVRVGVYEIRLGICKYEWYSYWDGSRWCYTCINVNDAFNSREAKTTLPQKQHWRGLAEKP